LYGYEHSGSIRVKTSSRAKLSLYHQNVRYNGVKTPRILALSFRE